MGVVREAAEVLRSGERRFAGTAEASGSSSWTLRDALLVALGCHRRAGPLAYWQWRELHAALREARDLIVVHTEAPPRVDAERWANQPSRTVDEVLAALDAVPEERDVQPLDEVSLRPWCDPSIQVTCRIPFVPLASLVHAWADPTRGWSETADRLGLTPDMTSWDLLDRLEPQIRDVTPPEGVARSAGLLRDWMVAHGATSPARWLFEVAAVSPAISLEELDHRASEAIPSKEAGNV